jgi:hypothetical protein
VRDILHHAKKLWREHPQKCELIRCALSHADPSLRSVSDQAVLLALGEKSQIGARDLIVAARAFGANEKGDAERRRAEGKRMANALRGTRPEQWLTIEERLTLLGCFARLVGKMRPSFAETTAWGLRVAMAGALHSALHERKKHTWSMWEAGMPVIERAGITAEAFERSALRDLPTTARDLRSELLAIDSRFVTESEETLEPTVKAIAVGARGRHKKQAARFTVDAGARAGALDLGPNTDAVVQAVRDRLAAFKRGRPEDER